MDTQFACVAPDLVDAMWPHVAQFIERATIRAQSDYTPGYVHKKLVSGDSLLWVSWADKKLIAAGTTEICKLLDEGRVCVITTFGGRLTEYWEDFLDRIELYAKEEQCDRVRLYGRPGWARFLRNRGYKQPWIALEKRV